MARQQTSPLPHRTASRLPARRSECTDFETAMFEPLEPRKLLAGVTIVAHGHDNTPGAEPWVMGMVEAIEARIEAGGLRATTGTVNVSDPLFVLGDLQFSVEVSEAERDDFLSSSASSGEIVLGLDWSLVAEGSWRTDTVAAQLADRLVSGQLWQDFGSNPLAELPLHLIGHSRGASLMIELAHHLQSQGVWIDQLTLLDPHPAGFDPTLPGAVPGNIVFADNYYQMTNVVIQGTSLDGAWNRLLDVQTGGYEGLFRSHSNVHLWYHGTIDRTRSQNVTDGVANLPDRREWYAQAEASGTETGWLFSRLGGGIRNSHTQPAGDGTEAVIQGLHWAFSGQGERGDFGSVTDPWPNLLTLNLSDGRTLFNPGANISLDFAYSTGAPYEAELVIYVDRDTNPYNGNFEDPLSLASRSLSGSGTSVDAGSLTASLEGIGPGTYFICGKIRNANGERYLYLPSPITVSDVLPHGSINPSTGTDGTLVVGLRDGTSRAIVQERRPGEQWNQWDLNVEAGGPETTGDVVTWVDRSDHSTHAAAVSAGDTIIYRRAIGGEWTRLSLPSETNGEAIVRNLNAFVTPSGGVNLIGMGEDGDLLRYYKAPGGDWGFMNLTDVLYSNHDTTPSFTGPIIAYTTQWGALNITGIDAVGDVWQIWWTPTTRKWQSTNLTVEHQAPQLVGNLTVYQPAWQNINIAGLDADGNLRVIWWSKASGAGQWFNNNLTDETDGPRLLPGTLGSYVSTWNGMNVVGADKDTGEVKQYWWSPQLAKSGKHWQVASLDQAAGFAVPDVKGPFRGLAGADASLNVFAFDSKGDPVRYHWYSDFGPGNWKATVISTAPLRDNEFLTGVWRVEFSSCLGKIDPEELRLEVTLMSDGTWDGKIIPALFGPSPYYDILVGGSWSLVDGVLTIADAASVFSTSGLHGTVSAFHTGMEIIGVGVDVLEEIRVSLQADPAAYTEVLAHCGSLEGFVSSFVLTWTRM